MRRVHAILAAGTLCLASAASASGIPGCVTKTGGRYNEPGSLNALLECQRARQAAFVKAWQSAEGRTPPKREMDRLEESQQREVRDYLGRHPDRASTRDEDEEDYRPPPPSPEASALERLAGDPEKDPDMAALAGKLRKSAKQGKGLQPADFGAVRDTIRKKQGAASNNIELLLQKVEKEQQVIKQGGGDFDILKRDTKQSDYKGLDINNVDEWLIEGNR